MQSGSKSKLNYAGKVKAQSEIYFSHTELFNAKMQFECNLQFGPHWAPTGLDNMGNLFHTGGPNLASKYNGNSSGVSPTGSTFGRLLNCCWGNLQTEQLKMQFEACYEKW